jgi:seryl-tRNA synthetase
MPKKDQIKELSPKDFQKLTEDVDKLRTKYDEQKDIVKSIQSLSNWSNRVNDDISYLKKEIDVIKKDILLSREQIEQTIKTQEEIIMNMIKTFNEELLNHKNSVLGDIQTLKSQQDVLKISNTVNDKKLDAKIKDMIDITLSQKIQGKEHEILMKLWINDFKEIISNFDKLKVLNPKEFSLKLNEISEILDIYKEKLQNFPNKS